MDENTIVQQGRIMMITDGEGDSYGPMGTFRVLRAFSPVQAVNDFIQADIVAEDELGSPDKWIDWMIEQGYLESLDEDTLHFDRFGDTHSMTYHRRI